MADIRGLVPVLATPFTDNGSLDEASLRKLVGLQLAAGVDGLATLGFASEAATLTAAEREMILRWVADEIGGQVPLIAGLGGTGAVPVAEEAKRLEEAGAEVLMLLPPYLIKPDEQRLIDFYGAVAEAVSIPIMVQDATETGVPLGIGTLIALTEISSVRYAKLEVPPTMPKIAAVNDALGARLPVLGGRNSQSCLEEFAVGAIGTMPASFLTEPLRQVVDLWFAGDKLGAQQRFNQILPLMSLCASGRHGYAVGKEILRRRGVITTNIVRNPMQPLDPATVRALDLVLKGLPELIEFSS